MEENREVKNSQNNISKNQKIFFYWFVGAIIAGLIVYGVLVAIAALRNSEFEKLSQKQKEVIVQNLVIKLQKEAPQVFEIISKLDVKTKDKINEVIREKIEKLYAPVYNNVDKFVEFHYSLKGDYLELFAALSGKLNKFIKKELFPAGFDKKFNETLNSINSDVLSLVKENYKDMQEELADKLGTSKASISYLMSNVLNYSINDALKRYQQLNYNTFRAVSAALGGFGAGLMIKSLTKKIAKKMLIKAGAKVATKAAASGGAAASGAAAGFAIGGPIGAAIGGLIGAGIVWITTDEIIIQTDKYFNSDSFKKEVIKMIDNQKEELIKLLTAIYTSNLDKLHNNIKKEIQSIKNRPVSELIKE